EIFDALRHPRRLGRLLADDAEGTLNPPIVDVADVGDLDIGQSHASLDVVEAATQAHDADNELLAAFSGVEGRGCSQAGSEGSALAEELTPINCICCVEV